MGSLNGLSGLSGVDGLTGADTGVVQEWWDPNAEALPVVGAYRAIATVGSPWGYAPTVYADTLQNWDNPGVNDLTEGNGAVPWAANTGWQFVAASLQYLIATAITGSYTVLVRFSNYITVGTAIAGTRAAANARMELYPGTIAPGKLYRNAGQAVVLPNVAAGNMGVVGPQGYFNGVAEGAGLGGWGAANNNPLYIGAHNNGGVPASYCDANIAAVAVYSATITPAQALTVATAMAAL